jgi:hypothetical protein
VTPRTVCMMAVFALLANAALALWLRAESRFWKTHMPVTFESVSSNGRHACVLKFGYGYVDLDLASQTPDETVEFRSFHLRY